MIRRRLAALGVGAAAIFLIAGCAAPTGAAGRFDSKNEAGDAWSGRLSLRVAGEPPQTFAALFDLRGNAAAGELTLTSPIGSTLARLRWAPGEALLQNGSETRQYSSVDALLEAATGTAIPVAALFGWLAGRDAAVPGWRVDLANVGGGRLQAWRDAPAPTADLRIAFQPE